MARTTKKKSSKSSKSKTGLVVTKPVSFWNQEVKIDARKAFVTLSSALISAATADIKGCLKAVLSSVNIAENIKEPGQAAWALIFKSYLRTLEDVLDEYQDCLIIVDGEKIDQKKIADILSHNMECLDLILEVNFFENPSKLAFIKEMEPAIDIWLQNFQIDSNALIAIKKRIARRFVVGLHNEWRENSSAYSIIFDNLNSPFLQAQSKEQNWTHYKAWLVDQTQKRMFSETFGLADVFVPLRAYYETYDESEPSKERIDDQELNVSLKNISKNVINLEEEILSWVSKYDDENCIKIISGGPGSGKSSCSRMLARKICEEMPNLPVLYVPLHQFDIQNDLVSAMRNFISGDRYISDNPLDPTNGEERLLIIFDGLDELSMQGKAAADAAKTFVDIVIDTSNRQNNQNLSRQYLITGREIAVQAGSQRLKEEKQIFHLLPYLIDNHGDFIGKKSIIKTDQRKKWWKLYGACSGKKYKSIPLAIKTDDLIDITKEPLLNYLVALSFERKK